jgi:hypothetical protein
VTSGRVRWAAAAVCVRDDRSFIAFFQSNRTTNKVTAAAAARWPSRREREVALRAELLRGEFELVDRVPAKAVPTLTVACRGDGFSVRFAERHGPWQPEYVNICLPFRRSTVGFDSEDLCLDLVLEATGDGSISWAPKDDDDLSERAQLGIYGLEQLTAIRAAAATAVRRLDSGDPPFDGSWATWEAPSGWSDHRGLPDTWCTDLIALK